MAVIEQPQRLLKPILKKASSFEDTATPRRTSSLTQRLSSAISAVLLGCAPSTSTADGGITSPRAAAAAEQTTKANTFKTPKKRVSFKLNPEVEYQINQTLSSPIFSERIELHPEHETEPAAPLLLHVVSSHYW